VQLYVNYPGSLVPRPERELKGFARVFLEPGETQTVEIPLVVDSLSYYDVTQESWTLESLQHEVRLGTSSRDLPLSTTLAVE
jgi:beta-glucosidase